MKIAWSIFLVFCGFQSLLSHNSLKIDSLQHELLTAVDTNKIVTLNSIAVYYIDEQPDSAIKYLKISLKNSKLINYDRGIAHAFGLMGNYYSIVGDYDVSEDYFDKSIGLYKTLGDKAKTAHFQIMKASLCIVQKNYVDAFLILNEVKTIADEKIRANVNYSIAYIYHEIENYEEALKYIHLSLKYYEKTNNNFQIAICNNFLGSIYSHLDKNDLALKYYNNSLKLVKDTVSNLDYALVIGNIGMIKNREKKYGEAIDMYQKAAEILVRPGDKLHLANIYNNMANTYYSLNKISKSEEYYQKAKTIYIGLNDEKRSALCLLGLANLYQETNPPELQRNITIYPYKKNCTLLYTDFTKPNRIIYLHLIIIKNIFWLKTAFLISIKKNQ